MLVHGAVQVILDVLNGQYPNELAVMEVFNALGIIFLRKAI